MQIGEDGLQDYVVDGDVERGEGRLEEKGSWPSPGVETGGPGEVRQSERNRG